MRPTERLRVRPGTYGSHDARTAQIADWIADEGQQPSLLLTFEPFALSSRSTTGGSHSTRLTDSRTVMPEEAWRVTSATRRLKSWAAIGGMRGNQMSWLDAEERQSKR